MTQVSELLALKIENAVLKLRQLQAVSDALSQEHNLVLEQARAEVGAPQTHVYNLDTRLFQAAADAAPLSTTPARQAKRAAQRRGR